jgi:hypothetical protein
VAGTPYSYNTFPHMTDFEFVRWSCWVILITSDVARQMYIYGCLDVCIEVDNANALSPDGPSEYAHCSGAASKRRLLAHNTVSKKT